MSQTNTTFKIVLNQSESQGMGQTYHVNLEIEESADIRNGKVEHIGQIGQVRRSKWANSQS